jgi:two-component system cell cycle response regulator
MTAKVLVVDDIDFNVKLLDIKLKQEYYLVYTAVNGKDAIEKARQIQPDIILMDVMMPEMDGFEATHIIKMDKDLAHIPVIMVTALNAQEDKIKGLEAGADDFLTKPINDQALISRLKSLVRLKLMTDELRIRDITGKSFGISSDFIEKRNKVEGARVLLIEDDPTQVGKIIDKLKTKLINVDLVSNYDDAIKLINTNEYSLLIVSTLLVEHDGLRLCSELRSIEKIRHTPILILVDENDERTLEKGLEIGVNDYLLSPIDLNELLARVVTQIKKKNFQDELKENYLNSLTLSITDPLTGLYNRRYFDTHIINLVNQSKISARTLSVLMIDIDNFKDCNDTYGHQAGDLILKEIAKYLTDNLRAMDLCARYGGEEFVVILTDANLEEAAAIGERIRKAIESKDITLKDNQKLKITISVGAAELTSIDSPEDLIKRADSHLYKAKNSGKNNVVAHSS